MNKLSAIAYILYWGFPKYFALQMSRMVKPKVITVNEAPMEPVDIWENFHEICAKLLVLDFEANLAHHINTGEVTASVFNFFNFDLHRNCVFTYLLTCHLREIEKSILELRSDYFSHKTLNAKSIENICKSVDWLHEENGFAVKNGWVQSGNIARPYTNSIENVLAHLHLVKADVCSIDSFLDEILKKGPMYLVREKIVEDNYIKIIINNVPIIYDSSGKFIKCEFPDEEYWNLVKKLGSKEIPISLVESSIEEFWDLVKKVKSNKIKMMLVEAAPFPIPIGFLEEIAKAEVVDSTIVESPVVEEIVTDFLESIAKFFGF